MPSSSTRQLNSVVTFKNSQGVEARGTLMGVTRQTISLEVYNPYSVAQMSEILSDLVIRRQDRVVYKGSAVVTTLVNTGMYLVLSATLTHPWRDLVELVDDKEAVRTEIGAFLDDLSVYRKLRPDFQVAVSNLRTELAEISRWVERLDMEVGEARGVESLPDDLLSEIVENILPRIGENMVNFEEQARMVEPELVDIHRVFAQRDIHPLMLRSPFLHRSYVKPLGYAGDYEMVNMMLRDPNEGPNSYFKLINNLFLKVGPAEAHRNRIEILIKRLEEEIDRSLKDNKTIHILNLGCGPAVEIQRLLKKKKLDERVTFTLLDFSEPTLKYTSDTIGKVINETGSKPTINYVIKSVDQILRQSARLSSEESDHYDFIYCAGLFDYFSDRACARILKLFHNMVKPGCKVLATNVHSNNPVKSIMEYLAEWHLVYRDEAGMAALVPKDWGASVYCDDTGVNVFLEYTKTQAN